MFRLFIILVLVVSSSVCGDELWSLTQKGKSAAKKGDFTEALGYFTTAAAKFPDEPEALYNKGLALSALGKMEEAEAIYKTVKFEDKKKTAELSYARGRLSDYAGDFLAGQKKVGEAKKAYQEALKHYANAIDTDSSAVDALKNIEIASIKLAQLPKEEENKDDKKDDKENKDDKNKDDKNQDKDKKDSDDKDEDEQDKDKKDEENKDDKDEEKENDGDDKEDEDEKEQQPEPSPPSEEEQKRQEALMMLEQYSDDAKELNKPTKEIGVAVPDNGKDW